MFSIQRSSTVHVCIYCMYVYIVCHLSASVRYTSSESCRVTSNATSRGGCETKGVEPNSMSARSVVSRRSEQGSERSEVKSVNISGVRDGTDLRRETNV